MLEYLVWLGVVCFFSLRLSISFNCQTCQPSRPGLQSFPTFKLSLFFKSTKSNWNDQLPFRPSSSIVHHYPSSILDSPSSTAQKCNNICAGARLAPVELCMKPELSASTTGGVTANDHDGENNNDRYHCCKVLGGSFTDHQHRKSSFWLS